MGALEDYREMIASMNPGPPVRDQGWYDDLYRERDVIRKYAPAVYEVPHHCWYGCFDKWHINESDYRAGKYVWKEIA